MPLPKSTVCIVGVGLIGGALGLALRRSGKYRVVGLGRDPKKLRLAVRMGAVDRFEIDPIKAVADADIVVICVPVHRIAAQLSKISPALKKGSIVSDVGSVKGSVLSQAKSALRKRPDVNFVGAHPIAGSEKTGVQNATADLFSGATCVITTNHTRRSSLQRVREIWTNAGASCVTMTASEHDHFLALTSHLPHLLAFALLQSVSAAAAKNPVLKSLVAGSFRDMTRIAGADPELWAGIVDTNRAQIQKAVRTASTHLTRLSRADLPQLLPALRRLQQEKKQWPR
jgi:prephenate dehydrogenase